MRSEEWTCGSEPPAPATQSDTVSCCYQKKNRARAVCCCLLAWLTMEDSRSFLRQTNEDGVSVYSHLTEVLATLLINEKPDQALESLEGTSLACKKTHYSAASAIIPAEPPEAPVPPSADEAASAAWHSSHAGLLAPKSGEEEPGDQGEVKDTLAERALFEWCAPRLCNS